MFFFKKLKNVNLCFCIKQSPSFISYSQREFPQRWMNSPSLYPSLRYGKRSAQEDVVAELLFGSESNRDQRSRWGALVRAAFWQQTLCKEAVIWQSCVLFQIWWLLQHVVTPSRLFPVGVPSGCILQFTCRGRHVPISMTFNLNNGCRSCHCLAHNTVVYNLILTPTLQ